MFRSRVAWIASLLTLICACAARPAAASPYYGKVTFNGMPVPGVTVTATQGDQKFSQITDQGGVYRFPDLKDGQWKIQVAMELFSTIHAQITVGPNTPAGTWELTPLSMSDLIAHAQKEPSVEEAAQEPKVIPPGTPVAKPLERAPQEEQKGPPEESEQSADGYLVNGSVNNAATSVYSTNPAFGNSRTNIRALYNGGFATILGNSSLDARPFAVSGVEAPKNTYTHVTAAFQFGGPLNIPHLMPRGPNFFVGYIWTRNSNAAIRSGLVPTAAERAGDLSSIQTPIFDPATGLQYQNNQIPVSPVAQALLNLYPMPNPNISSTSGFNYQAPVLNSVHQDRLNLRLSKNFGRRDHVYGGYDFESSRSGTVNLFGFADASSVLDVTANIHWMHRYTPHLFITTAYIFSRERTRLTPAFQNRENISGTAGIEGNDQDPTNWGPPTLNFTNGVAGLSDGISQFNRNRSDKLSVSAYLYHGRHNLTAGFDFTKEDYNWFSQHNPRGGFTFTGAATSADGSVSSTSGSALADFLIGIPDTSAIAYGNADKYFREPLYDAFLNDDWRITPTLTINAGVRWQYSAPMTELYGRLVNLDINSGFTAVAPVLANSPVGAVTGEHYPASLMRPDRNDFEPRIAFAWRPIPASSVVVRGGYGIYHDTSTYLRIVSQLSQQAPLSKSLNVQNSEACPLTLANGFPSCSTTTSDQFAVDPNFRIGYSQTWDLTVQRDLPFAMQITATYTGIKGTHGPQSILPNSYPVGGVDPCPECPSGFVYETSGGNSTRHEGDLQLRRRLMNGFAASISYAFSKSIDDDAYLGGSGHTSASGPGQTAAAPATGSGAIAQNWRLPKAERSLSSFDQRQLVKIEGRYTSGEGIGGGTLMNGWKGRLLKEWTLTTTADIGTGLPETPIFPATVPGTGVSGSASPLRPNLTGASIYDTGGGRHINAAAYTAPGAGQWGNAGRNSITGPGQFTLDSALSRTFRPRGKLFVDLTINATNLLNHPEFTSWNTLWEPVGAASGVGSGNPQFGLPASAGSMRSLETILRVRF